MSDVAESRVSDGPSSPRPPLWPGIRALLMRLHFYAGILVGPFILIAAITGLPYTITPQLEQLVHREQLTVAQIGEHTVPLADQVAAARQAHPEGAITEVRPPRTEDGTTRVVLAVDDVPDGYGRTVFVDPYSGEVRGALTTYGEWLPVRAWIDELHRNLHLGEVGRHYSELAASWLWLVALGGLIMWWGMVRRRTRAARAAVLPDRRRSGRARTLSWHGAVGVWIVLGLVVLSASGLTWSRYAGESISDLRTALDWTSPTVTTALSGQDETAAGGHGGHGAPAAETSDAAITRGVGIDGVFTTAVEAGLQVPIRLIPPSGEDQAWTVREAKRSWPTRYDALAVDPADGRVVDRVDFSSWPLMAKMTNWVIDTHMGILFGWVNQIVLALVAIGLITVVIRGYRMWWSRRPRSAGRWAVGAPPARGTLTRVPVGVAIGVILVAAIVGWYVPLLGISLAGFVAVDVVVGLLRARADESDTASPTESR
ncbi:PepSY-associated TM helix domain-containing protein [Millisia brevis]|uniref:PepSY-associated TM helix domain-containing protein n=1 Tax=Millisia brevis TaxID=264148 RepID=UPI000829E881|nr:PepSY domain-containing protein [Millisia brevis]